MRNPGGYAVWTDPDVARDKERDTYTCKHHNGVLIVEPGDQSWAYCGGCDGKICPACYAEMARIGKCVSFERKIEESERKDRLRRQLLGDYT